jgi:hypothetical protein
MIFDSTCTARSTSDLFIRVAAMNEAATAEQRPPALRVIARLMLASVCGLAFGFTVYVFLLSLDALERTCVGIVLSAGDA